MVDPRQDIRKLLEILRAWGEGWARELKEDDQLDVAALRKILEDR